MTSAAMTKPINDAKHDSLAFTPSAENSRDFRNALGRFGTGVTIVTTSDGDKPLGITVNSFSSVSLDPALVLWSVAKTSYRYDHFKSASHYAIHVLDHKQADLAMQFAKDAQSFSECDWLLSDAGVPLIEHCNARFECQRVSVHDGGDHSIVVGKVVHALDNGGDACTLQRYRRVFNCRYGYCNIGASGIPLWIRQRTTLA